MFKRILLALTPKQNVISHAPAKDPDGDEDRKKLWNDKVHPHMPRIIAKEQNNIMNAEHRANQIRFNFTAWQMSHGIAEKLLSKTPYSFTYAKPFKSEANLESEAENNDKISEGSGEELTSKSNAIALQDQIVNTNAFTPGRNPIPIGTPGQEKEVESALDTTPKSKYTIRNDLVNKYHTQWSELDARKKNMFYYLKRAIGYGLGINCSAIVKKKGIDKKDAFWVFSGDQIIKIMGKNRIPTDLEIQWPAWGDVYEETNEGFLESQNEKFKIGTNCTFIVPIVDSKSPKGEPYIAPVWDTLLYKSQNRFLHAYFLWKGGVISKYFRVPRSIDADFRKRIELESKKPMGGESIIMEYPPGKNPETVDKMFQHDEVLGLDLNWEEANSLNSQDTPYPESFVKGNVESGALGGMAPKIDKEKEDEELMRMFKMLDPIIKDINITFFGATEEEMNDCIIIPWQDEQTEAEKEMEDLGKDKDKSGLEREIEDNENPPEEKMKLKGNTIVGFDGEKVIYLLEKEGDKIITRRRRSGPGMTAKKNSVSADGTTMYLGNLFKEGWLPQDDGSEEWIDGEDIKAFVEDPKSVKEGYMQYEHPKDRPDLIFKSSASARYKVIGYDDEMKTDITEFYVYDKDAPAEIFTSPMYFSRDVPGGHDGKTRQTELDVRNAVFTSSPRSGGTTSARKL